jgi:hypothetical protein
VQKSPGVIVSFILSLFISINIVMSAIDMNDGLSLIILPWILAAMWSRLRYHNHITDIHNYSALALGLQVAFVIVYVLQTSDMIALSPVSP